MGRHADPDPRHFYGSLIGAAVRGLMAVGLAVGLYVVLASFRPDRGLGPVVTSDDTGATDAAPAASADPEPSVTAPPIATTAPATTPRATAPSAAAADPAGGATPSESPLEPGKLPSATTVQVLDGVGDQVRAREAAAVLRNLGYQVVVVNPAGVDFATTTVLYSRGHEPEARGLMARDARFAAMRPNPNLSESVDLHVAVGRDWPR
ncbi:MAG: LytR C-terminal domain-containing protein [Actinomycetota bacterium]|nr:LytR C-terminal domain-containing protein [Actinomycetota bacterium]